MVVTWVSTVSPAVAVPSSTPCRSDDELELEWAAAVGDVQGAPSDDELDEEDVNWEPDEVDDLQSRIDERLDALVLSMGCGESGADRRLRRSIHLEHRWLPRVDIGLARIGERGSLYTEESGTGADRAASLEGFVTLRWVAGDEVEPEDLEFAFDSVDAGPASVGAPEALPSAAAILGGFAHEPTVALVQGWAEQQARSNPDELDRWLTQARRFAALPDLELQLRVRNAWDLGWGYRAEDGVVDRPDESLYHVLEDAGEDGYAYYAVKASWDLGDLVMSNERIRMLNEAQDLARLREDVLSQVTKVYFERRRLQVAMELEPPQSVEAEAERQLEVLEMTAELDAMTGGRFSEHVRGEHR
jgi:hypothetical protein